ncbi:MAG: NTP transferase domain-containing protein, partial [Acidimicrobiales bacterium]
MIDTTGVWTIVVAAGSSRRFGADKLDIRVSGTTTVLDLSVARARLAREGTALVLRPDDPRLSDPREPGLIVVGGGPTRSDSVRCGLAVVPPDASIV